MPPSINGVTKCHCASCSGEELAKKTSPTGKKPWVVPMARDAGISVGQRVPGEHVCLSVDCESPASSGGRQLRRGLPFGLNVLITCLFQAKVLPSHPDPSGRQLALAAINALLFAAISPSNIESYRLRSSAGSLNLVVVYLASSDCRANTCSLRSCTAQQIPTTKARRCMTLRFSL